MEKEKLRLLPSLREKKRYLVLIFEKGTEQSIKDSIDSAILDFIGTLGYAEAGPMIVDIGKHKNKPYVILSINREYVDKIKSAFALRNISCIGVSGSVKKAKIFL